MHCLGILRTRKNPNAAQQLPLKARDRPRETLEFILDVLRPSWGKRDFLTTRLWTPSPVSAMVPMRPAPSLSDLHIW